MALTVFTPLTYAQILQNMLNDYKATTSYYGYNISVDPGSEVYLRFSTVAGTLAVLYNLANNEVNSKLIDTATGSDLDRVANDFGLQRKGAVQAQGSVQLVSSVSQSLTTSFTLTGPNSIKYQVAQNGVYSNNANVPIISINGGADTNLPVGSVMSWGSALPNMQSTCSVSVAVTGGADVENDNTLRNRLYLNLQSPPQMGNTQQVVSIAGSVDGVIQQAYVYSNFNGAGTQLIALTGYQTSSYIGRDIPHLQLDGYIKPYGILQLQPGLQVQTAGQSGLSSSGYGAYNQYTAVGLSNAAISGSNLSNDTSAIYGQMPGTIANPYATVITTVNNFPTDVALTLTIPYPVGAPVNGLGGGWQDFTPWPVPDGYYVTDGFCKVIVANSTTITVRAPSSGSVHTSPPYTSFQTYNTHTPTNGQTHIQWVNRSDALDTGWVVVTATILTSVDNGNDTWTLTLDTPLTFPSGTKDFYGNTGVTVGDFIFPASLNSQNYLNIVMEQYGLLGPGQVTSSQGLLALGTVRYPSSNTQFPMTIGVQLERALVVNNTEVFAASANSSAYSGATPNLATAYNTAFAAPATNSPPNIYVPRNVAFYPSEQYNFGN